MQVFDFKNLGDDRGSLVAIDYFGLPFDIKEHITYLIPNLK